MRALLLSALLTACSSSGLQSQQANTGNVYDKAIVGGTIAEDGEFAHAIKIVRNGAPWCAGTMLSNTAVLTTADCVAGADPSILTLQPAHSTSTHHDVEAIHVSDDGLLAILTMDGPVFRDVPTVQLFTEEGAYRNAQAGTEAAIAGWGGASNRGQMNEQLQYTHVPVAEQAECSQVHDADDNMVCAGWDGGGRDACDGDQGGGLVIEQDGDWVQLGVFIGGQGECGQAGRPGLYARVAPYRTWIEDHAADVVFTDGEAVAPLDDHGNSIFEATPMLPYQHQAGFLDIGDVDMFRIQFITGGTLRIEADSLNGAHIPDSIGTLRDANGHVLQTDDDSGPGNSFRLEADLDPGVYYVEVRGYANNREGAYELTARLTSDIPPEDDHADTTVDATWPEENEAVAGALGVGDVDVFSFDVHPGDTLHAFVTGDVSLKTTIYDDDGNELQMNDDLLSNRMELTYNGLVHLFVEAQNPEQFGTYTLFGHRTGDDDHGDTIDDATPIQLGEPMAFELRNEADVFRIDLPAGASGRLEVRTLGSDEVIADLLDADGRFIDSSEAGPANLSQWAWGSTYYVSLLGDVNVSSHLVVELH